MKPHALATLGLRILAVYLISQSFMYLASAATTVLRQPANFPDSSVLDMAYIWVGAPLIIGLALWMAAPLVSYWATRRMSREPLALMEPDALAGTAFVIAGVLIVAQSLPYLALETMRMVDAMHTPGRSPSDYVVFLTQHVVQCLIGVLLVVGSRGVTRFVSALRYGGSSGRG